MHTTHIHKCCLEWNEPRSAHRDYKSEGLLAERDAVLSWSCFDINAFERAHTQLSGRLGLRAIQEDGGDHQSHADDERGPKHRTKDKVRADGAHDDSERLGEAA